MKKEVIKKIGDKEDKRTYKKEKDYNTDMTYENELNRFFDDIANNTPNEGQFDES